MIYAIIVVYNKECKDSISLQSLYRWKNDIKLVVFDNSTKPNGNAEYCEKEKIYYLTKGDNIGLSRAYNHVLDSLKLNDNDYVIILDDDTELNDNYVKELQTCTDGTKEVILPIVYNGTSIISPANIKYKCSSRMVKSVEELDRDNMSAINSGMLIKASVFNKIRYNEQLFLDCVDHEFMRMVRKEKLNIHIMDSFINQNFSRNEKPKLESALHRFRLYRKDFRKFCQLNSALPFYYMSIGKFVLSYSIKYRTTKFLKILMEI